MSADLSTPEAMSAAQLAPIREWARANRGAMQRIAERMGHLSGKPVNRHMVGRWLATEDDKRIQPVHGYALLLEQAVAELQDEDAKAPAKVPTKRKRRRKSQAQQPQP